MTGLKSSGGDIHGTSAAPHLRERELANRWEISQRTLQRMRAKGQGPAYVLIGGSVRYRLTDVLDYEHRRLRAVGG